MNLSVSTLHQRLKQAARDKENLKRQNTKLRNYITAVESLAINSLRLDRKQLRKVIRLKKGLI